MYTHLTESTETQITGYKIAIKIDGNYYSPATYMQYSVGELGDLDIPRIETAKSYGNIFDIGCLIPNSLQFEPNMVKRTSVFENQDEAERTLNLWKRFLDDDVKDNMVLLTMVIKKTSSSKIYEGKCPINWNKNNCTGIISVFAPSF